MANFLASLAPYRKAVVAFLIGVFQFVALFIILDQNGLSTEDKLSLFTNIIAALGGTGAVYQTKNAKE